MGTAFLRSDETNLKECATITVADHIHGAAGAWAGGRESAEAN
jgi:hypothetical protein